MATKYWLGGDSGNEYDWSVAANWSPSGVPADDDTVIFDGRSTNDAVDGMAQGGITLDLLQIKSDYAGTIGDGAAPLCINPDQVIFEGTGDLYLKCKGAGSTEDTDIDKVIVNSNGGSVTLYSDVNSASWASEFTELDIRLGDVVVAESCDVRTIRMVGGTLTIGEECQRVKATADLIDMYVSGGTVVCDSPIGTLEIYGGTVTLGTAAATPTAVPHVSVLRQWGGTFNWEPIDSGATPELKQAYWYGGTFYALGANPKQIGNNNEIHELWPDATVDLSGSGGTVILESGSVVKNYGGTLKMPSGTSQTW